MADAVALNLAHDRRGIPTSLKAAVLQLEHALAAAELMRDQARDIQIAARKEEDRLHHQIGRLNKENTELAKRVGELTVVNRADAETILAIALRRIDLHRAFRHPGKVTIKTHPSDYKPVEFRPATVTLDDAISDKLMWSIYSWVIETAKGGSAEVGE